MMSGIHIIEFDRDWFWVDENDQEVMDTACLPLVHLRFREN